MSHLTTHKHREYSYLRPYKAPVICRLSSVVCPLHLSRILYKSALFMQNKPNLVRRRRIANVFYTMTYENLCNRTLGQNKPNSNPIKPNLRKAKMDVNSLITKGYRKKDDFIVRINKPNSNPIPRISKMNVNSLITKDYRKYDTFAVKKTNPIQTLS